MTPSQPMQKEYGRLTLVRVAGTDKHKRLIWLCQCMCGKSVQILGAVLKTGLINSCGCDEQYIQSLQQQIQELMEMNKHLTKVLQDERPSLLMRILNLTRR